jgi:hypothetical protein
MASDQHQPVCLAAHHCINKLAAIISHCDLLLEMTVSGSEYEKRLQTIRVIAKEGIVEMNHHQNDSSAENEKAG